MHLYVILQAKFSANFDGNAPLPQYIFCAVKFALPLITTQMVLSSNRNLVKESQTLGTDKITKTLLKKNSLSSPSSNIT